MIYSEVFESNSNEAQVIVDSIRGVQGLVLHRIMPPIYCMLLVRGEKYECGSDYSPETLVKSVGDLNKECDTCFRKGCYYAEGLHDDVMLEDCNCQFANGL